MAAPGKCFLVTGPPGVGKTTLIIRVLEALKQSNPSLKIQGFYTRMPPKSHSLSRYIRVIFKLIREEHGGVEFGVECVLVLVKKTVFNRIYLNYLGEVREGAERVGFEVVTLDGRRGPLASTTISSRESQRWPTVGRYKVDVSSFESLALPELQVKEETDLFIIDEVGKMELFSSSFFPAVLRVLESNIPLLATVPVPKFGRDIPGVARLKNHPGATIYSLNPSNRDAMKEQIYSRLAGLLGIH